MRTLVWYRGKDLRASDHAPLRDAVAAGEALPLFVLEDRFFARGRARRLPHRIQFLLDALRALERRIAELGSRLVVIKGDSTRVIPSIARAWHVDRVVAHRAVEPRSRRRDAVVQTALAVPFELYDGETLAAPCALRSSGGTPYAVYSAFARAFSASIEVRDPLPAPRSLPPWPRGIDLARAVPIPRCQDLGITPNPRLLEGGEAAGRTRLRRFLQGPAERYDVLRDRLDLADTSRLSVDLKYGTLSPRTIYRAAQRALGTTGAGRAFLGELIWREFSYSTLWDRPDLLVRPFRPEFTHFPWGYDARAWEAWSAGKTGYPIVDAAARQLLGEGFVHNRARMITASFLTKHLLIHYKHGEAHFMSYLTDGDPAQNNAGWQWSAGCGCDAQPYFRVFNPVIQGRKFDPEGAYVRRWVPELARVPDKHIHAPWQARDPVLRAAGVRIGKDYPLPIVNHAEARDRFLMLAEGALRRRVGEGRAAPHTQERA
jgi:deoxyribodipyrimidine photo-lyase